MTPSVEQRGNRAPDRDQGAVRAGRRALAAPTATAEEAPAAGDAPSTATAPRGRITRPDLPTLRRWLGDAVAVALLVGVFWYFENHDGGYEKLALTKIAVVALLTTPVAIVEAARLPRSGRIVLGLWGAGVVIGLAFAQIRADATMPTMTLGLLPLVFLSARRLWDATVGAARAVRAARRDARPVLVPLVPAMVGPHHGGREPRMDGAELAQPVRDAHGGVRAAVRRDGADDPAGGRGRARGARRRGAGGRVAVRLARGGAVHGRGADRRGGHRLAGAAGRGRRAARDHRRRSDRGRRHWSRSPR